MLKGIITLFDFEKKLQGKRQGSLIFFDKIAITSCKDFSVLGSEYFSSQSLLLGDKNDWVQK